MKFFWSVSLVITYLCNTLCAAEGSFVIPPRVVFCAVSSDEGAIARQRIAQGLYNETRNTLIRTIALEKRVAPARLSSRLHRRVLTSIAEENDALTAILSHAGTDIVPMVCASDEEYIRFQHAVALADRITNLIKKNRARE